MIITQHSHRFDLLFVLFNNPRQQLTPLVYINSELIVEFSYCNVVYLPLNKAHKQILENLFDTRLQILLFLYYAKANQCDTLKSQLFYFDREKQDFSMGKSLFVIGQIGLSELRNFYCFQGASFFEEGVFLQFKFLVGEKNETFGGESEQIRSGEME